MNGSELHAVLGASGGIGSAVVRELVRRGYRVRAVNRRGDADVPEGVERRAGDASTPEGARAAVAGASVVYHAAQPPYTRWPREFPPMTDNVIAGAATAGAKVVFADNLYMYGPAGPQPMTEGAPRNAAGKKGKTRILMEERLLEAHRSGRVRTTMGRSSDYYGPRGTDTVAGDRVFGAAVEGKTARWLGSLDRPHTLNYLPDMARALVTLGEREEADGEAWHLPAAEPITGRRFLEMVFAEAGGAREDRRGLQDRGPSWRRLRPVRPGGEGDDVPVRAPVRLRRLEVLGDVRSLRAHPVRGIRGAHRRLVPRASGSVTRALLRRALLDRLGRGGLVDWSRASVDSASIPAKKRARKPAPTR
jgi:nucleoside-diphosphate-sugar epimerase